MAGSRKCDIDPGDPPPGDDRPDRPSHLTTCRLAIGLVRAGTIGAMFVAAGGWTCPGCAHDKVDAIYARLNDVVDSPLVWCGEIKDAHRRAAARQAQRLPRAGRVVALRHAAPALVLAEGNLTPRTRALRPRPARRGILEFVDTLLDGPTPKRVDWSDTWRPQADKRTADPAVRAGMGPADLWAAAVEAAGFQTGIRVTGRSDVEIAAAIDVQLEVLRSKRDGATGWKRRPDRGGRTESDIDIARDVS
jgi:hypothetical protein